MSSEPARSRPAKKTRPAIRLWNADQHEPHDQPRGLSSTMTLLEFYEAYIRPVCREAAGRADKTLDLDRTALKLWREITGDPPLEEIDQWTCSEFVAQLCKRPGKCGAKRISPNTVRKHCTHLQLFLDRAGPRSRINRLGQDLLEAPPYLERPKKRYKPATDSLSVDEIARWLDACPRARLPRKMRGFHAETYWRALVLFTYNTGLRIDTVMCLTRRMLDGDWLIVPPEIYKGGSHGGQFFVNRHARAAIESVRQTVCPTIFPWPGWPKSDSWLQEHRRRLWEIAGIRRPGVGFHGLRKALITWVAAQNAMLAKMVAGHSTGDVTQECYVHPHVVEEIMQRVPQPGPVHQKRLFD